MKRGGGILGGSYTVLGKGGVIRSHSTLDNHKKGGRFWEGRLWMFQMGYILGGRGIFSKVAYSS